MPDTPPSALSDIALRETLDLLGQVVASMSARIDRQGEQIAAMARAVEKTRAAACRTEQQTDPAAYARFIGSEVEKALDAVLDEFASAVLTIRKDHETTAARLKELEQAEEAALERLRQDPGRGPGLAQACAVGLGRCDLHRSRAGGDPQRHLGVIGGQ